MTNAFPDQRFLRGNFAPLRVECDAPDLVIEGELPRELNGTLLRNGPNPLFPPRDRYHMFSGDGMVHDFIVTATHVVLPLFPLTIAAERARRGGPMLAWEPEKPSLLGWLRRDGYFATTPHEHGRAAVFDQLARYDFALGSKEAWTLPAGNFTSEAVFVPRDPQAPEGCGWLLAVVYRGQETRSDLMVLDAENVTAGPLAVARLETRVPFGFHGNWMPG